MKIKVDRKMQNPGTPGFEIMHVCIQKCFIKNIGKHFKTFMA